MAKQKGKPYQWIRAWCVMMGSSSSYTEDEITRAREDDAPADAIYPRIDNVGNLREGWTRASEVTNPSTRWQLGNWMHQRGHLTALERDAYIERGQTEWD